MGKGAEKWERRAPLPLFLAAEMCLHFVCVHRATCCADAWAQNYGIAHLWHFSAKKHSQTCSPSLPSVLMEDLGELGSESFTKKSPAQGSSRCHVAVYVFNLWKLCSGALLPSRGSCAGHCFGKKID